MGDVAKHPPGSVSLRLPPCSDIYLMEKELAKDQERNNRHRPPKIMEPPSFQEPPPKVSRGQSPCRQVHLCASAHWWVLQKGDLCGLAPTMSFSLLCPLQPSRPRYKPPPQSNLLAPKLQFQVRWHSQSIPQGHKQGVNTRKPCLEPRPSWAHGFGGSKVLHTITKCLPPPCQQDTVLLGTQPCPALPDPCFVCPLELA